MERKEATAVMQHNLVHIRKCLNLSTEKFGNLIGVTKQTINNIESGRTPLSITQYLAIKYVLDNDIFPNIEDTRRDCVNKLLSVKAAKQDYMSSLKFEDEEA